MSDAAHPHNRIPAEELIADLQRVAEDLGETPTSYEYDRHGRYSHSTQKYRFGSWNAAVEEAGLDPNSPQKEPIPDEELIADVQRVAEDLGYIPNSRDYHRHGAYSHSTLNRRFESWTDVLDTAGFDLESSRSAADGTPPTHLRDRKYGTIEVFEHYWVLGQPSHDLPGGIDPAGRGIPMRDRADANALREGRVRVDDLWDDYLSEFQHNLALELWALRYETEEVDIDG